MVKNDPYRDFQLDARILRVGKSIWDRMRGEVPGVFDKDYWQGRILEWAMDDPQFKVDLFRFIDVLPMLETPEQISRHIREYLIQKGRPLPPALHVALKVASGGIAVGMAAKTIRDNVAELARRFIVGNRPEEALSPLKRLHREGIAFTVDLVGEATISEVEADVYQQRYLELIDTISSAVERWRRDEVIDRNHLGPIPRANVSLKVSSLDSQLDSSDLNGCVGRLKKRVLPILLRAKEKNVFIHFDLEQWDLHEITYTLFEEVLNDSRLRSWPHIGIVVQAYLKEAERDLDRLYLLARSRRTPIVVRLVKGAYWDYERVRSKQFGYPFPLFTDKAATDANFEKLTARLFERIEYLHPAIGSHNLRSLVHAVVLAQEMKIPKEAYEIQMLYGMAEPERTIFRSMGHRVRVYAPVGELLPGIAYLVRRLLENTSNSSFLRLSYHEGENLHVLLARPRPRESKRGSSEREAVPFRNAPRLDFVRGESRDLFAKAVEQVRGALPIRVPIGVGGEECFSDEPLHRVSPSDKGLEAVTVSLATREQAERAVGIAAERWPQWRRCPIEERAELLQKLSDRLEADRFYLAALQTYEVGKPWREADADVVEAIDFCRYYAGRALIELQPSFLPGPPGERNLLLYEGRGPTVVIAPWNFPLAILCGMTTAALVAGNTVLMKPAEQSSASAYELYRRMIEVGFSPEVVQFLPGIGEEIGDYLVQHPEIAQIAFTGSKEVGLSIIRRCCEGLSPTPLSSPPKGESSPLPHSHIKHVICEMGGKNAIIIDDDADLDEAVKGVVQSAFGYAGQKCSASSRVIVVGSIYRTFRKRLIEACRSLTIAPAHRPECRLGPVIDQEAYDRLQGIVDDPGGGAELLFKGEAPLGGFYLAPVIFEVSDSKHRLMQEELFGPILTLMRVENFRDAIKVANATEFALTGGVYSRTPSHLEEAQREFRVGNLYLNRGCTGAVVSRQPFGGFAMSGKGTKAGGPGYLLQFVHPRVVTENTTRHGFTPEVDI